MRIVLKRAPEISHQRVEAAIDAAFTKVLPAARADARHENFYQRLQPDIDHLYRKSPPAFRERTGNPFAHYDFLDNVPDEVAAPLCDALKASGAISAAGPDPFPGAMEKMVPFAARATAPFPQNYLKQAPTGVDSFFSKSHPGGDGEGVACYVIEKSFLLPHPDLPKIQIFYGTPKIDRSSEPDHGTGTLGIIASMDDACGTVGIAFGATVKAVSVWPGESEIAIAIIKAAADLNKGGVLCLTAQTADGLPSETNELIRHCIELATVSGRVVVEAAGNGSRDLDTIPTLHRGTPQFVDSGAVLVGAASEERRQRLSMSNFGSRVDCFACGEKVATTYPPSGYAYASGTSAATAIVCGTAVVLQAMYKCRFGTVLEPHQIRDILHRTGTAAGTSHEKIGRMPDLCAAFNAIQNKITQTTTA